MMHEEAKELLLQDEETWKEYERLPSVPFDIIEKELMSNKEFKKEAEILKPIYDNLIK